jgi:hypothetical protein
MMIIMLYIVRPLISSIKKLEISQTYDLGELIYLLTKLYQQYNPTTYQYNVVGYNSDIIVILHYL